MKKKKKDIKQKQDNYNKSLIQIKWIIRVTVCTELQKLFLG